MSTTSQSPTNNAPSSPRSPSPASFNRREGFFEGHDGLTLFFQTWEKPEARGTVLITHGQGEHSECYHRVVDFFRDEAWSFHAWDLRGHGRSEGKRGYASSFEDYLQDARIFFQQTLAEPQVRKGPVVLLSHSMGGLIQLNTLLRDPTLPIVAQVCSSPLLGLALPVPPWKEKAAHVLMRFYPQATLWNEIRDGDLTRDPEVLREFERDVLRHNRISPGVFLGFQPAWEAALAGAPKLSLPTLFQVPEEDPVVSTPAARAFFDRLGSREKTLAVYPDGARHEMYNDTHRKSVLTDLAGFLRPFLEKSPS